MIPLADRAGLIQWVGGAVPLFSLYKNWYKRNSPIGEVRPSGIFTVVFLLCRIFHFCALLDWVLMCSCFDVV